MKLKNKPINTNLLLWQLNSPLSLRERARVRGQSWVYVAPLPPHPAFGHLLPQGEGTGGRSVLIRKNNGFASRLPQDYQDDRTINKIGG
jgi:hypothetical protein